MARTTYTLTRKMQTLWLLREHSLAEASAISGIPTSTIRDWHKQADSIRQAHYTQLHEEGLHRVLVAQNRMADKIIELVGAIDADRIGSAPLNQLASTLGVLVDRFLRIHDAKDLQQTDNNTYRIEYYDARTDQVSDTPPWATDDSVDESALHRSYLWQTLWQDRTGEADRDRDGLAGEADLVAGTDLSDGESGLARPQGDDARRARYSHS
ncbi:MAG: hypothetical protein ACFE0Q_01530 [Anaerolineae bacterium]